MSLFFTSLMGIVIGMIMGLTGAGGGILAVPGLMETMHWKMQQAMPVALLAVTVAATIGAYQAWRKQLVRYRAGILMALIGMPMTAVGVFTSHQIPQQILLLLFSGILFFVSWRLLSVLKTKQCEATDSQPRVWAFINRETGRFEWNLCSVSVIGGIGAIAGFTTGLLGVGGGFVMVPMLRRYTQVSMHGAVATSLFVIALVGSAGVGNSVLQGAELPFVITTLFVASAVSGMLIGRRIVHFLPERKVQLAFASLLLFVAIKLIYSAFVISLMSTK